MNSFTKTTSGAYGDVPPNANRAATNCSAANAMSAVRSTIATTLLLGETSCEYVGWSIGVSCKTERHDNKDSAEGLDEMTAKVSASSASASNFRRREGSARRLFSS
jgi:hypothetical protein